jgi:hypothetical protein
MILLYPFKTLKLVQPENNNESKIFNYNLLNDLPKTSIHEFTRFLVGEKIGTFPEIKKIFSWSEFQVIERAFNLGVREKNKNIRIYGCQFYINPHCYFNSELFDIDYKLKSSPHIVLVNGKYYLKNRKMVKYRLGVSLRYEKIYKYNNIPNGEEKQILLLLTYFKDKNFELLMMSKYLNEKVIVKPHPTLTEKDYMLNNKKTFEVTNKNIYDLFPDTLMVITSESGTAVEAVACGVSVLIIGSKNNFTLNPLDDYGKGEIWDIAFRKNDFLEKFYQLKNFRKTNIEKIKKIASWYKKIFFVEPTEKNIIKAFDLEEMIK